MLVPGFPWTLLHVPFPFVDFPLYPFATRSLEFNYTLNPLSKSSNLGMILGTPDTHSTCPVVSPQEAESSKISSHGSHGLSVLNCKNQIRETPNLFSIFKNVQNDIYWHGHRTYQWQGQRQAVMRIFTALSS